MRFRKIPLDAFGSKPIIRIRNIEAVVHNYRLFRDLGIKTNSRCAVVLKGNAHGLGMSDVAPALYEEGVKEFFIEELIEGLVLRKILPHDDVNIYAMAGLLSCEEESFMTHRITPCLNSLSQIEKWNAFCGTNTTGDAVIHLDTEMNRIGLSCNEVQYLAERFQELTSNLEIKFYMSHLFDIKGHDFDNSYLQLETLKNFLQILPKKPVSFACTDSLVLLPNSEFNFQIIRPGIGIVGGAPNENDFLKGTVETLEMYTKISQVKDVKKGSTIGYGGSFTAQQDMRIALAHIGYKDGYLRLMSKTDQTQKGGWMYIGNYKAPIVGKISLGITTIDVSDVPDSVLSEIRYAEVVGPNVKIRQLADLNGCYEIMASLGRDNMKIEDYTLKDFAYRFGNHYCTEEK
ncbi:alanine racemase [Leptolyngbya sp. Heron Island J]|uniref:alanine racemase n=1 Tax=Leptolyngbya sp. Heron Island J TaxID=1385935 RepID=UPI0003B9DCB9|nr:alanine racemase [Leptolyngbya sp. Heron Island J]ESA36550.1 alanine racemase [Leptolyngbya sp. Heron Island J]